MYNIQKITSFKAVTTKMLDVLMDIHEREILNAEQDDVSTIRSVGGLITRGYVNVRKHVNKQGKELNVPFITRLGKEYLNQLKPKE